MIATSLPDGSTDLRDLRFVVLLHQVPADWSRTPQWNPDQATLDHWDLMLEWDGRLLTWAVETEPFNNSLLQATQLADHRLDYLSYEGPVSGQRGRVRRLLSGSFQVLKTQDNPSTNLLSLIELGKFRLRFQTEGRRFQVDFSRVMLAQAEQSAHWELTVIAIDC